MFKTLCCHKRRGRAMSLAQMTNVSLFHKWTPNIAYVIGLITTDGNLSKDGRHIDFTSKDLEQIATYKRILHLNSKIGTKSSGPYPKLKYYRIQFGNVKFYKFLLDIGLMPNKSKILGAIKVPDIYFIDFLRGSLDGDGCTYSYWDKRWKSSFMLYTVFVSASKIHLEWIREKVKTLYGIEGKIKLSGSVFQLVYAKKSSILLLDILYYSSNIPSLSRKRFKIEQQLGIIHI